MNNFVLIIAVISIIFVAAAIFLGRLKKRWPKYMPAVLAAAAAIATMIKAYQFSEGFEALGYIILMLLALIVFVVSLIAAVVIEIIGFRKRRTGGGSDRTGPDGGESGGNGSDSSESGGGGPGGSAG